MFAAYIKLISSPSFHRLDMTLAVAEALNPNKTKPNQAYIKGPPLDIGGGGGLEFLPGHFYFFTREMESFIFSPQDRLEIFLSTFILYLFQLPLWIKYLSPPCLNCGHLFISPIFLTRICISTMPCGLTVCSLLEDNNIVYINEIRGAIGQHIMLAARPLFSSRPRASRAVCTYIVHTCTQTLRCSVSNSSRSQILSPFASVFICFEGVTLGEWEESSHCSSCSM